VRGRRGLSLVEVIVVLGLLLLLGGASLAVFGAPGRAAHDRAAQQSLSASLDLLVEHRLATGSLPEDPVALLSAWDNTRTFSTEASLSANQVALSVDGPVAQLATAAASGHCWFARLDIAAPAASQVRWGFTDPGDPTACTPEAAAQLADPGFASATSPRAAARITGQ
jgi:type II secretory pathway pseudopilin PulG